LKRKNKIIYDGVLLADWATQSKPCTV